jgi:hypothetical protein
LLDFDSYMENAVGNKRRYVSEIEGINEKDTENDQIMSEKAKQKVHYGHVLILFVIQRRRYVKLAERVVQHGTDKHKKNES